MDTEVLYLHFVFIKRKDIFVKIIKTESYD